MGGVIADNVVYAPAVHRTRGAEATPPFQPELLRGQGLTDRLAQAALRNLGPLFALLRCVAPVLQVPWMRGGSLIWFALITRHETVRDVLNNAAAFTSPYGSRLQRLSGSSFLLGRDEPDYRADLKLATSAFPLAGIPKLTEFTKNAARETMDKVSGGIDVMADLANPVLSQACQQYLGVMADDPDFALWAMAIAAYVLEPLGREHTVASAQADAAATCLREIINSSQANLADGQVAGETVLQRLVAIHKADSVRADDTAIRALIFGVIIAMIPTGMLAIGHIMEMLLRRPEMMEAAQQAARAGNPEQLRRCLFEALRFKPIIPVWPRDCRNEFHVAVGEGRSRRIRAGSRVLVSTHSAMLDPRQVHAPNRFDPERQASDYMHFGQGLHYCLGAAIASAVIPAILEPLLLRDKIAYGRSPPTFFATVFPERFPVTFPGAGLGAIAPASPLPDTPG